MDAFDTNSDIFDLTKIPTPSEGNLNNKLWSRIIEALFSKTAIKIIR
jgi:hypothetical protein